MKVLPEAARQEVLDFVNDELDQQPLSLSAPVEEIVEQPSKRLRLIDEFDDDIGCSPPTSTSEVIQYQSTQVRQVMDFAILLIHI